MEELKSKIGILDEEIKSKTEERNALIEALAVLEPKNAGKDGKKDQSSSTIWGKAPNSVRKIEKRVERRTEKRTEAEAKPITEKDRLDHSPTLRVPNSTPKKLCKEKFKELKTVKEMLEIFGRVWPEAYQHKLKRLPGQLVKFPNPKFDYMIVPAHLNNVGVTLLGGKLRRNDARLQDEENPFWARFWHGVCNLLRNELLLDQRFSIKEISRWENSKVAHGFFTLTIQVHVYLSPKERAQVARGIQFLQNKPHNKIPNANELGNEPGNELGNELSDEPGNELESDVVISDADNAKSTKDENQNLNFEFRFAKMKPIGNWADVTESDDIF